MGDITVGAYEVPGRRTFKDADRVFARNFGTCFLVRKANYVWIQNTGCGMMVDKITQECLLWFLLRLKLV